MNHNSARNAETVTTATVFFLQISLLLRSWAQLVTWEATYIFESDDVWVLTISQKNLNFFRGVPFAFINYLKKCEPYCNKLKVDRIEEGAVKTHNLHLYIY